MSGWINQDPMATAFGTAAAFFDGQQDAKDKKRQNARDDERDRQTAIANQLAVATQQERLKYDQGRDAAADARGTAADRRGGVGLTYPKDLEAKPDATPYQQAQAQFKIANWYDEQGATDAAKEARNQAAAILNAANKDAGTALVIGKGKTEAKRPALIVGQTKDVNDRPVSRARHDAEALQLQEMRAQAEMQRAAIAQTAAWNRMVFKDEHPSSRGGGGRGGGGGRSGRGGSESLGTEYGQLSPKGQQFYDMLSTTNNQATPGQALAALRQSSLPAADKGLVAQMLTMKGASTISPTSQATQGRLRGATDNSAAIQAKIGGLPAKVQSVILKLHKQGVSSQAISAMMDDPASGLTDDVKAQAKAALNGL